ncbi:MAG: chromosome segregation protein SMC, partial [Bryobacteraceae bacterium]
ARVAEARKELDRLRSEFSGIQARRDSLQQILSHRAYTTEAVKRLFTTIEQGQAEGLKPYGVLADFVDVDATYEKAAEEFLHDELEYVVVESWSQAEKGIDLLRSDLEGRATFLVHPKGETGPGVTMREEPAIGPETGIVARLSDVLKLTNGLTHAPADLLPRLNRCFLAEDRTAAQRLASQYPGLYFLLPDGVCYSGAAICGGKKTGSGPLALKRELRELNSQFQTREKELDELAKTRERLEGEVTAFEQELERLRAAQQGQEKEALALDHEMRKVTEDLARANSRLSVARVELGRLTKEKERSEARRAEQGRQLAEMDEGRAQQERTLEAARAEIEQLRAEAVRVGEEHSASRAELAGQEERARAEQDSRRRLEGRRNEIIARRQAIGAEMERLGVERARLLADNIELDRRAETFAGDIAAAEEEVMQLTEREAASRATLAGLDEGLKNLRFESQQAQERRAQIELELVKRQSDLRHLDETSRKDLNVPISELVQPEEIELDELALADIEEKYQQVKGRIEALGPVNPQALEEYEESKQRYDFLNAQRQDLLDSIRDTEKAIHDIDAETRRRFAEAFEAVNEYFREMFKTLFGGGIGEMRLTDETNIGESGIDIVASPPGKKLQNVLLLSGGEKALTAVALLMAIFRYQPSPFCVMDEVDAPLDESNIQRLARLIVEMSQHTQFILITHAKRTMEVAQALYGVTMQEPGVSKLVSVRFQQDAPPPPLVPSAPAEMQGAPN